MYRTTLLALLALGSIPVRAASSVCSGQQYNIIPGFPAQQSACYPTNYYRTSDLGQTSPDDARDRCEQQCTADSSCKAVVAQVNKAADQANFYPSGTCFFFANGQTVAPRRCADTAYLLEGYMKDATLNCFSSSLSSASQYCSSYLHIPVVTSTATSSPATVSTTTTVTTTNTLTATSITVITPTVTNSLSTTITKTTATTTLVNTATVTAVTTITQTVQAKKMKRVTSSSIPLPACVTSGTPATRLSAACSCLSVSTSTSTTTTTLATPTSTATSTSTVTTTTTRIQTSVAATVTTAVTGTMTSNVVGTITSTVTVTTTVPTTVTVTSIQAALDPSCTGSGNQCLSGFVVEIKCGQMYSAVGSYEKTVTEANYQACAQACASDSACVAFNFGYTAKTCMFYTSSSGSYTPNPDSDGGRLVDYC